MDTYRGYDVQRRLQSERPHLSAPDGFYWIDERGFEHGPYGRDEEAFDGIDAYKRDLARGAA